MNEHEHFEELMSLSIDGELSPEDALALREHLSQCPDCARVYGLLDRVHEALSGAEEPPEELSSRIMEAVGPKKAIRPKRRYLGILAAAAVLALIVIPPALFLGGSPLSDAPGGLSGNAAAPEASDPERYIVPSDAPSVSFEQADMISPIMGEDPLSPVWDYAAIFRMDTLPELPLDLHGPIDLGEGLSGYELDLSSLSILEEAGYTPDQTGSPDAPFALIIVPNNR